MDTQKDPQLNHLEQLQAENNVLKLKLGLEYGMREYEAEKIDPEIENQWLKNIYAFEQQFKDAKRVKLYDFIGRPKYRRLDALAPHEVHAELERLQALMENNGVQLDCICEYDDTIIYRFITEELFDHEMDDMRIEGMTCHFIYEEFHPNHDYDIRRRATNFIQALFARKWDEKFDTTVLAKKISFSGTDHDAAGISAIIHAFQDAHRSFHLKSFDISDVVTDAEFRQADVRAALSVSAKKKRGERLSYEGNCFFRLCREHDCWSIAGFDIPGIS